MTKSILLHGCIIILLAPLLIGCDKSPSSETSSKPSGGTSGIYCLSLGWEENESGQRQRRGFEEAFAQYNIKARFANANYNAKLQSEQIDAFIKLKPAAIFVAASGFAVTISKHKATRPSANSNRPRFSLSIFKR